MQEEHDKQEERRNELNDILSAQFNREELRTLCFSLAIDYEELSGKDHKDKARELIVYMQRKDKLHELGKAIMKLRPELASGDNQERQRIQRRLTGDATQWSANNHDSGFLYRGAFLAEMEEWAQHQGDALNELERAFLAASSAEREHTAREQEALLEAQKAQLASQQAFVDQLTGERDYLRQALATALSKIPQIKASTTPVDSEAESPQTKTDY